MGIVSLTVGGRPEGPAGQVEDSARGRGQPVGKAGVGWGAERGQGRGAGGACGFEGRFNGKHTC